MRRRLWILLLAGFLPLVGACAGGSGSSGFDILANRENNAIVEALDSGACVDLDGLTICPESSGAGTLPRMTSTPMSRTPTPTATGTPGITEVSPSPGASATPTPPGTPPLAPTSTPVDTTARTRTPTPTATPTVASEPVLDILLTESDKTFCLRPEAAAACRFVVSFFVAGFEPTAVFRVAVRPLDPSTGEAAGAWALGGDATPAVSDQVGTFDGGVEAVAVSEAVGQIVQFAVLVFPTQPAGLPDHVDTLGATGATVAFVTGSVEVF